MSVGAEDYLLVSGVCIDANVALAIRRAAEAVTPHPGDRSFLEKRIAAALGVEQKHAAEIDDALLILDFTEDEDAFDFAEYGEAQDLLVTLHDRDLVAHEVRAFIAELIDAALDDEIWSTLFVGFRF